LFGINGQAARFRLKPTVKQSTKGGEALNRLDEILAFNRQFVENHEYEPYRTSKFPKKKLITLSCMDARLSDLLPRAMDLNNGDAKFIKNAGAVVSHPFGSIMRSILVAVYELGADEVLVIGHYGCGMSSMDPQKIFDKMVAHGISRNTIEVLEHAGINLRGWFERICSVQNSVQESVAMIRHHPLVPETLQVHGLVIDPETGRLDVVINDSRR
jgi:carbonic anhydrase